MNWKQDDSPGLFDMSHLSQIEQDRMSVSFVHTFTLIISSRNFTHGGFSCDTSKNNIDLFDAIYLSKNIIAITHCFKQKNNYYGEYINYLRVQ